MLTAGGPRSQHRSTTIDEVPDTPNRRLPPSGPPLGGDRAFVHHRRSWWQRHRAALVAVVATVVVVGGTTTAVLATRNLDDVAVADPSLLASLAVPSSAPVTTTAPTTAAAVAATPTAPRTTAKGTVVAVVSPGRWTISVEHGLQLTVVAAPTTTYAHNRTADDVRRGNTLSVVGTMTAGVITAQTVTIEKSAT